MRKDAGVDGDAQRLGQLSWLLFLKIFDTQEEELELEQDDYSLPIPNAICGAPGRQTAKALPAMRCWNSSTTICSQN
jgi:type I restriction-modification system DNA methylase subunit